MSIIQPLLTQQIYDRRIAIVGGCKKAVDLNVVSKFDSIVAVNEASLSVLRGKKINGFYCYANDARGSFEFPDCDWLGLNLAGTLHPACMDKAAKSSKMIVAPYYLSPSRTPIIVTETFEWLPSFHIQLGTVPLTGLVALCHVLFFQPKEVFLTGFDFYAVGKMIRAINGYCHLIYPQWRFLRDITLTNKKISIDETLWKVLNLDGYYFESPCQETHKFYENQIGEPPPKTIIPHVNGEAVTHA